jgi:hypothetical protein
MKLERSITRLQVPDNCSNPEPDQSSPYLPFAFPEDPSLYYSPIYVWVFQVVSFPQASPPTSSMHLALIRAKFPVQLILQGSII